MKDQRLKKKTKCKPNAIGSIYIGRPRMKKGNPKINCNCDKT